MESKPPLRRLIDLPGVAELERKALMNPRYADPDEAPAFPEIDACAKQAFGLTLEEAEAARPADWDGIDRRPDRDQVLAFEAAGWDVTDDRRRPLRMLGLFKLPLWLAVRGIAGALPFHAAPEPAADWGASLAGDAKRFKRDR